VSTWVLIAVFLFEGRLDTQRIENIPTAIICEDMRGALSAPFDITTKDGKHSVVGVKGRCLEKKVK